MRHPPQCWGSLLKSVQTPEQETWAPTHRQCPAAQTLPPEHMSPQPPQFVALVWRLTHPPPHAARLPAQVAVHTPAEQTSLMRQTLPQAPQLAASLAVSVHWVSHMMSASGQTQAPPTQASPSAHETPQPPQLETLVLVSTHAAPHDIRGSVQATPQVDWSQT
jgi:hypothetical protein